jgi:hypothetical protein
VEAFMHFLRRSPKYETEKPYSVRFPLGDGLEQSNILRDKCLLQINTMRGRHDLTLEECGFEVMRFSSALSYEDFDDPESISGVYLPEVCKKLKQHLSAAHVIPIDFAVSMANVPSFVTGNRRHPLQSFDGVIKLSQFPLEKSMSTTNRQPWLI